MDELHTGYLLDAALLRPESLAEAWEWAIEQRLGVASLLVPGDVEQTTWRAFDYLADAADANVADVPDAVWRGALDHASDDERWMIGRAAYDANRWDVAEFAWWPLAERGESRAMNNLGILLENRGDHEAAAKWIDRAADAESDVAMFKVAMRLRRESRGRFSLVSAEYWLRRAAEAGHVPAMYELAHVLDSGASMSKAFSMLSPRWAEERLAETEMWFRRAAEAGDARAVTGLAELLLDAGRLDEAETWFQRFADTGNPDGLYRLAVVAMRRGDSHAVESALRDAAGAGHARAGYELAGLLRRRGEFDEADRLATRAIRHETRAMSDSISAHIRNR
ncbi:SEL1-like repeat protein [Saccharopolyspora elongata]|uniref:Sel1 repeat family protein n=1 Tax=Saccharopolyspora elongata TaxID=2530387 RepID=A0A4R4XUI0_9PSEU|nr:tetratricopeptide repeat protein [Saccharopolyspora elongata]TDD34629.1 sel1 repeat family protein [Saccharopolyspora elongata]